MVNDERRQDIPESDRFLMLSEADRQDILETLDQTASEIGDTPFEEMSEFENIRNSQEIERLFNQYSPEAVWDQLIYYENEDLYESDDQHTPPPFCSAEFQDRHKNRVAQAERGEPLSTTPNSFGLYAPSYSLAIQDDLPKLRHNPNLRATLLGTYGPTSGEEFDKFMNDINPKAYNTVVDLSNVGLEAIDRQMGKIQGDVTQLPIRSESQDLIFTNFLIPFLHKGQAPLPKGGNIVAMIKEAYRALRPNGKLVLCEGSYRSGAKANNMIDTLTMYLVSMTLKQNGFGRRDIMYAQSYNTHPDKLRQDKTSVTERRLVDKDGQGQIISQNGFLYTIAAEKTPEQHSTLS